jgi:hypothetical protein
LPLSSGRLDAFSEESGSREPDRRRCNKNEENVVSRFQIFIIRAILGLVIALVITRAFYGGINPAYVAGLAFVLVGLAYFAEYLRHRRKP